MSIFPELRKRAEKAGQPPGTPVYTGKKNLPEPYLSAIIYTEKNAQAFTGKTLESCLPEKNLPGILWLNVQGLENIAIIQQIAARYGIHPLTVEDILNVQQRPKIETFEHYEFITLKILIWDSQKLRFSVDQLSLILGENYLLSFQENETSIFNTIRERLTRDANQRLREQGSDYLAYRLIDTIVDYYFVVLEGLGNRIDSVEEMVISNPKPQNTRTIYRLKRQMLLLRKSIWPMREIVSHLLQIEEKLISPFTRIYLRDLYDHIVQAIDTVETFRDILSNLLDVYLTSLTNRMNEVMKTLTIIATIFIPMTFIASVYGMNFIDMPELHWHWGYYAALGVMLLIASGMLFYFHRKKWI